MMTGRPGIFAGGTWCQASNPSRWPPAGKKTARPIDAYLRGSAYVKPEAHEPATFSRLNTWYYTDADASEAAVTESGAASVEF